MIYYPINSNIKVHFYLINRNHRIGARNLSYLSSHLLLFVKDIRHF